MIKKTGEVNCLGFVYFRLGLQDKEEWLWTDNLQRIREDFKEVPQKEADMVAILLQKNKPILVHFALLDPTDKQFIIQRKGPGAEITRDPLIWIYSEYYLKDFQFKFLKLKQNNKITPKNDLKTLNIRNILHKLFRHNTNFSEASTLK